MGRDVLTGRAAPYGRVPYRDPELVGNFRLCAVDQKRSFFPRVGPFLGLLPFKGPFPLTGAPQTALRALLRGGFLWGRTSLQEGPLLTKGSFTGMGPFTKKDDEEAYGKPLREGRYLREGPVLARIQNWAGISACVP